MSSTTVPTVQPAAAVAPLEGEVARGITQRLAAQARGRPRGPVPDRAHRDRARAARHQRKPAAERPAAQPRAGHHPGRSHARFVRERPVRDRFPAVAVQQPAHHGRHVPDRAHLRGDQRVRLQPLQVPRSRRGAHGAPGDPAHPGHDAAGAHPDPGHSAGPGRHVPRAGHRLRHHPRAVQHLDPQGLLRHGADRARGGGAHRRLLAAGGVRARTPAPLHASAGNRVPVQLPGGLERVRAGPHPHRLVDRSCSPGRSASCASRPSSRRSGATWRRHRCSSPSRSSPCSCTAASG